MEIDACGVPGGLLCEYADIPIAFEVKSVLLARRLPGADYALTERPVTRPYIKDYDADSEPPHAWSVSFDTTPWRMWLARSAGKVVGGATVAVDSSDLDLLEGRSDLAVLWDIRVAPASRGQGVGAALFRIASMWAREHGCSELKVETQDINVPACRFYAAMGCQLRVVRRHAYPTCPRETQYLWYAALT